MPTEGLSTIINGYGAVSEDGIMCTFEPEPRYDIADRPVIDPTVTVSIAPHPATAAATITITVPTSLDGQPLTVTIVDILGCVLAEIASGTAKSGTTHVSLRQRSIAPRSYRDRCCGWSPLVRNSCHE